MKDFKRMFAVQMPEAPATPTELYKRLIMDTLSKSIQFDCDLDREKYIKAVKNLLILLRPHISRETNSKIKAMLDKLNKEIEDIKKKNLSDAQKKLQIVEKSYDIYETIFIIAIDTINNSPIVESEVEGILVFENGMDDIKKVASKIRKTLHVEEYSKSEVSE